MVIAAVAVAMWGLGNTMLPVNSFALFIVLLFGLAVFGTAAVVMLERRILRGSDADSPQADKL
jgi:uncharacterized membrane protein